MAPEITSTLRAEDWKNGDISTFDGAFSTRPEYEASGLAVVEVVSIVAPYVAPCTVTDKHAAPYFVPSLLQEAPLVGKTLGAAIAHGLPTVGKMRSASHVIEGAVIKLDLDGITDEALAALVAKLNAANLAYVIYTTHSHGREDKPGNRLRPLLFLDRKASPLEYQHASMGAAAFLLGQSLDPSEAKLHQQAGIWATHPDRSDKAWAERKIKGRMCASTDALLALAPPPSRVTTTAKPMGAGTFGAIERQKVWDALGMLDPNPYDTWTTACACMAALGPVMGDDARGLWLDFCERADEVSKAGNDRSSTNPEAMYDRMHPSMGPDAALGTLLKMAKETAIEQAERDIMAGALTEQGRGAVVHLAKYHRAALDNLYLQHDIEV